MNERKEAWMRIVVGIVSGIVLGLWKMLITLIGIIHWFIVVFSGKRNRNLAEFCENWNTQTYTYVLYMTFMTNQRPFPFNGLKKTMSKFEGR